VLKRGRPATLGVVGVALALLCFGGSAVLAQERPRTGGAGPPDPPPWFRGPAPEIDGPSVVEGQKAGIEVGSNPPDFELQPIEPYAIFQKWLGDDAPKSIEHHVRLSQLVGKAPIMLLFGSYT